MKTYEGWLTGRGFAANTIKARAGFYRARVEDWGTWDLDDEFLATWLRDYRGWTRRVYHAHLVSIYEWLVEGGQVAHSPMLHIRRPPPPRANPRPLTEDLLTAALQQATPRTRNYLLLGYLAGLRASEIASFHGASLDRWQIAVHGKGGVVDHVPTHPLLWGLAQQMPANGYWFPPTSNSAEAHVRAGAVTDSVGRLFRAVGIDKGSSHRARHTYATNLLRSGSNLRVVQRLMRHRSIATTELYTEVVTNELEAAILRLPTAALGRPGEPGGPVGAAVGSAA